MPIRRRHIGGETIMKSRMQTITNTVNCVGVMGKGVALRFKTAHPRNFSDYQSRCNRNEVRPGVPYVFPANPKRDKPELELILNFPTKNHWRNPSEIEWVEGGLAILAALGVMAGPGPVAHGQAPRKEKRVQAVLRLNGTFLLARGGFRISAVDPNGPGAKLELPGADRPTRGILDVGDVITAVEGRRFEDRREFLDLLNDSFGRDWRNPLKWPWARMVWAYGFTIAGVMLTAGIGMAVWSFVTSAEAAKQPSVQIETSQSFRLGQ